MYDRLAILYINKPQGKLLTENQIPSLQSGRAFFRALGFYSEESDWMWLLFSTRFKACKAVIKYLLVRRQNLHDIAVHIT